jgi:acyl carrier protein
MSDLHHDLVSLVISRHLDVEPRRFEPSCRLDEDLGLDPLDLVLIALRLEELVQADFPLAALEFISNVDELASIVRTSMRNEVRRAA